MLRIILRSRFPEFARGWSPKSSKANDSRSRRKAAVHRRLLRRRASSADRVYPCTQVKLAQPGIIRNENEAKKKSTGEGKREKKIKYASDRFPCLSCEYFKAVPRLNLRFTSVREKAHSESGFWKDRKIRRNGETRQWIRGSDVEALVNANLTLATDLSPCLSCRTRSEAF